MIKLVLRFFILCIFVTILTAFLVFYISSKIDDENDAGNFKLLTQSVFASLDTFLAPYPATQWQVVIDKFRPEGVGKVTIVPFDKLPLNAKQVSVLKQGEAVTIANQQDPYESAVVYRRAGQSKYVYKSVLSSSIFWMKYFFGWPIQTVSENLHNLPESARADYLKKESLRFGSPVSLIKVADEKLSQAQKNRLYHNEYVIDFPSQNPDVLQTFYVPFGSNEAIKFGPMQLPLVGAYKKYILLVISLIVVELIIFILAILFARTLERLKKLADEYGHSNFDANIKISKTSTLYPLFSNLQTMGRRIKLLLSSHKELTNTVSHELRTPISRLRFSLELIREARNQDEILNRVTTMEEDVAELEDLVSEILTYAQLDRLGIKLEMKNTSLNRLMSTAVDKLAKTIKAGKKIIIDLDESNDCDVSVNEKNILRALQNVMQNAVKHAKSIVKVSVRKLNTPHFEIIIEDDGLGIPEDARENIFNPFVQLLQQPKDEKKGFGLGLAITKKIVNQHNWKIQITDSPLGGAKIIFSNKLH